MIALHNSLGRTKRALAHILSGRPDEGGSAAEIAVAAALDRADCRAGVEAALAKADRAAEGIADGDVKARGAAQVIARGDVSGLVNTQKALRAVHDKRKRYWRQSFGM